MASRTPARLPCSPTKRCEADLAGNPAEFAMPDVLIKLAAEADVVLAD
jgi:hypothetical protein